MFVYLERDAFLQRLNPLIKLACIAIMSFVLCLSLYPVLPLVTVLLAIFMLRIGARITCKELFVHAKIFLGMCLSFMGSLLILRGFVDTGAPVLQWGIAQWSYHDIIYVTTLGVRMFALVTLSLCFVLTTRPSDLVLSLMIHAKLPVVHGFAVMSTYRLLPELQDEVDKIRMAQEIRGISWTDNLLSRLRAPFRLFMPLICSAARRGERVASALESRGLGLYQQRTYWRSTKLTTTDWLFLGISIGGYGLLCVCLAYHGWFQLSFAVIH